ncbi:hypothetical protein PMAC_000741 [Pneumocystis sp. 'macacae']|nr:hypothetical protein PMAC_000741 [Pneumocystis sp. 'macacae']
MRPAPACQPHTVCSAPTENKTTLLSRHPSVPTVCGETIPRRQHFSPDPGSQHQQDRTNIQGICAKTAAGRASPGLSIGRSVCARQRLWKAPRSAVRSVARGSARSMRGTGHTAEMAAVREVQDRIAAARREAEGLRAEIKLRKDVLGDTSCKTEQGGQADGSAGSVAGAGAGGAGRAAGAADTAGASGKDLCNAVVGRREAPCVGVAGRKADYLGRIYDEQDACNPAAVVVGDDVCICAEREACCVWGTGQHMHGL